MQHMMLRKTLSHIKSESCFESELFRSWIKGECSQEEWSIGIAVSEGSRCLSVAPRTMCLMSDPLRNYCEARIEGRLVYEPALANKLSAWWSGFRSAWEFNLERLEHYTWAADKTKEIKAGDAHLNLCKARDRFASIVLPEGDTALCLRTKELDANARVQKAKNS